MGITILKYDKAYPFLSKMGQTMDKIVRQFSEPWLSKSESNPLLGLADWAADHFALVKYKTLENLFLGIK